MSSRARERRHFELLVKQKPAPCWEEGPHELPFQGQVFFLFTSFNSRYAGDTSLNASPGARFLPGDGKRPPSNSRKAMLFTEPHIPP